MEPMVSICGLFKQFGNVFAVAGIDLQVQRGEFVALLGPSGCGKTTTLRCIAGLERIDGGEIIIDGKQVSTPSASLPPERRGIGMVFQSYAIWPHMTVRQNIAFGLKIKGFSKQEINEQVNAILDIVGLTGLGKRGVGQISGGQQQRVALARALVIEPKVLLFDEPLSNLDAQLRERMRFELRHLQQRLGITSIYVTHDQQEAMAIADRIVLMHSGKIVQAGTPQEIYYQPATRFAAEFVGIANLLLGTVVESNDSGTTVRLISGHNLYSEAKGFSKDQMVTLVIRPEEIIVLDKPSGGTNVLQLRVIRSALLGTHSDVYLKLDKVELRVQMMPARVWSQGKEVQVQIPSSRIILIPNTTEI